MWYIYTVELEKNDTEICRQMNGTSFHFMKLHFWGLFTKLPNGEAEFSLHSVLFSILPQFS